MANYRLFILVEVIYLKYVAIIFDVADTLVEFFPNYAKIYGDRLRSLDIEVSDEMSQTVSREVNYISYEQTQMEENGAPHISKSEKRRLKDKAALSCVLNQDENRDELLDRLSLVPIPKQKMYVKRDTFEVLNILREQKYRLAIVSNFQASLMQSLKELGLSPYFEAIIISEIVGVEKPNVRIMQMALDELELEPASCIYVGDQPLDVLCAKQAGMDCVWITTKNNAMPENINAKEDYKIENLMELLNVLTSE